MGNTFYCMWRELEVQCMRNENKCQWTMTTGVGVSAAGAAALMLHTVLWWLWVLTCKDSEPWKTQSHGRLRSIESGLDEFSHRVPTWVTHKGLDLALFITYALHCTQLASCITFTALFLLQPPSGQPVPSPKLTLFITYALHRTWLASCCGRGGVVAGLWYDTFPTWDKKVE